MSLLLVQQQTRHQAAQTQPSGVFSAEQVAAAVGAPLANVAVSWPALVAALAEFGIDDRPTETACAATVAVETGVFLPIREYGDDAYFERMYGYQTPVGQALGNIYPGDGARYCGKGEIQLTGKANYRRYGTRLSVDLEGNPDLALDPTISARVLAAYFLDHDIAGSARAGEWQTVRRKINGGLNGWAVFIGYVQALEAL